MAIVVKFGGSSLASAEQFVKAGNIIKGNLERRYIVPSAPGKRFKDDTKVTDMLYMCYELAEKGKNFENELRAIKARYEEIIQGLKLQFNLDEEFIAIENNFKAKQGKDYAASRGEYLNGIIMAKYIGYEFVDAASVIYFDENGKIDEKKTDIILSETLIHFDRAVIPGFYGVLPNGRIKTFSRGGSDLTGSIVAKAIKADVYENWKDVSGVLIADPRIVDNPKGIDVITYKELRELSYMGNVVFHEDAIFPVRQMGIPINIKNTNAPIDDGTWIVGSTCRKPQYVITGIAGKRNFCAINIEKEMMNTEVGFVRKILQIFEENGIPFEHIPSGIDTLTVFVHQDEFMSKEQNVLTGLHKLVQPGMVSVESELALIAVVGRGMKAARGTAARIFSALAHCNINIKMIDQGSSELNIIIGVSNEDFEQAIRAIYDIFVLTNV